MEIPWRGPANPSFAVDRLPLFRGLRSRKKCRYLGVYGPDVQMCVGVARIGGAHQAFWAVHNRTTDAFRERAALWPIVHFDHASARCDGVDVAYERGGEPAAFDPLWLCVFATRSRCLLRDTRLVLAYLAVLVTAGVAGLVLTVRGYGLGW